MRLPLTLALACRRGERDRGRLVAVELHGRLRRHDLQNDVHARSRCGRLARARAIDALRRCGALQTLANMQTTAAATCRGPAPGATTSTAAERGLSSAGRCPRRSAAWRAGRRSRACAPVRRPAALVPTEPPSHAFKRPAWYFASHARSSQGHHRLPRPSRDCAADDLRADRAHAPVRPLRAAGLAADAAHALLCERVGCSFSVRPHASAVRDQGLGQERLHRPDPREHHGAHQAGLPVRRRRRRCGLSAASALRTGTLRHRALGENRFSGSMPPTISALIALTWLCAPFARPGSPPTRRMRRSASAAVARWWFGPCGRMPCCAQSGTWTRTASQAQSSRASRRSPGCSCCAPRRRRPCGLPADSGMLNGHAAAQGPRREPLLRQRAADDLRADRAREPVRPHRGPPTGFR
jgi:hypothetical protein